MIIVDTSVWVEYFHGRHRHLRELIADESACVLGVVFLELAPFMHETKRFVEESIFLESVHIVDYPISMKDWYSMVDYQKQLLKTGFNGVGIPDLILIHNALVFNWPIYSLDKHIKKASGILKFKVFEEK